METIDVWYLNDQTTCNFDCPYCVTQTYRRINKGKMWETEESAARFRKVIEWISCQPYQIRIRAQTQGEPLICKDFLDGAAWLSRQPNVEFVELVTNGSLIPGKLFNEFTKACDPAKVSLWITYHRGQIEMEKLIENAVLAQSTGMSVVAHSILFPDVKEEMRSFSKRCREKGVKTAFTLGVNNNNLFPDRGLFPILESSRKAIPEFFHNPAVLRAFIDGSQSLGKPCQAGHRYISINPNGDVFPCGTYRQFPDRKLGSALDADFVLKLETKKTSPCAAKICGCGEDFLHLDSFRKKVKMGRSLCYAEPDSEVLAEPFGPQRLTHLQTPLEPLPARRYRSRVRP